MRPSCPGGIPEASLLPQGGHLRAPGTWPPHRGLSCGLCPRQAAVPPAGPLQPAPGSSLPGQGRDWAVAGQGNLGLAQWSGQLRAGTQRPGSSMGAERKGSGRPGLGPVGSFPSRPRGPPCRPRPCPHGSPRGPEGDGKRRRGRPSETGPQWPLKQQGCPERSEARRAGRDRTGGAAPADIDLVSLTPHTLPTPRPRPLTLLWRPAVSINSGSLLL